jgi:Na+/melibiose symporter-like transporter
MAAPDGVTRHRNKCCRREVSLSRCPSREWSTSVGTILLIILILVLIGVIPAWPYSRGWGYGPGGIVGLILIILLILVLLGRV